MVATTEKNPYAFGYARMPRIIRKGYTELSHQQKLLYIYLRDLCGEGTGEGMCYRSLRSLADETGFSIGFLSKSIPVLQEAKLIHAEMRKHSSKGNGWEVWHITIADIWEKNAVFIKGENAVSEDESTDESVHEMNKYVHGMNTSGEKCSRNERKCSRGDTNRESENQRLKENQNTIKGNTPESPQSGERFFSSEQSTSQEKKPLADQVLDEWDKQNGFPSDRSEYNTKAMALYVATLITQRKMCLGDMARLIALCEELDYVKKQGLTPATFRAQLQAQLKRLHKKPAQASTVQQQEQPRTHDSYGNAASAGKSPLDFILNNAQKSEPVLTH